MNRKILPLFYVLSFVFFFLFPDSLAWAQERIQYPTRSQASQYYLGTADEIVVPINIWGFVKNPGQYMVPNNTDLISLLSYAGGPVEGAKVSKIRIVRSDQQIKNKVLTINVRKYLETGDTRLIPLLKPGDTVVVKGTTFHWIQRFFSFLASFAVFAQIAYFIAIAQERFGK